MPMAAETPASRTSPFESSMILAGPSAKSPSAQSSLDPTISYILRYTVFGVSASPAGLQEENWLLGPSGSWLILWVQVVLMFGCSSRRWRNSAMQSSACVPLMFLRIVDVQQHAESTWATGGCVIMGGMIFAARQDMSGGGQRDMRSEGMNVAHSTIKFCCT